MSRVPHLGIKRIEALHYYVFDLERSRKFYTTQMDFAEVAKSGAHLEREGRQTSVAFEAGACRIGVSQPLGEGGRAYRYLQKHGEGVGTVVFEVEDADRAFNLLDGRGGTPITDVQRFEDDGGSIAFFSITTPFGDTTFRFVERRGFSQLFPGWERYEQARGGANSFDIQGIDHITSNFQTMAPALLWMEHVMGFERYWDIEFHTTDVAHETSHGSGLRSVVMWDAHSKSKFANNEPYRPFFKTSQINIFHEEHRGDGVQHVALSVSDIVESVRGMRARGVGFMATPDAYYDALPKRLETLGVGSIDEDIGTLRDLEILVDGDERNTYLLQIFLKESAAVADDPRAGPFFYEIIQRKGDEGFGGGNFRALFESIERSQQKPD